MKLNRFLVLVIGCAITIFALWYTTRGMDWTAFAKSFGRFKWIWLLPALATFYYSMYLRAVRWGLLFRPHHDLKGWQLFPPIMICFCFNSLLPARVGEFVRSYQVGKTHDTGVATALATVVVERVIDAVILMAMLSLAFAVLPPLDPGFTHMWGKIELNAGTINLRTRQVMVGSAVLTAGMIAFMIPWTQEMAMRIARRMPWLPQRFREKFEHFMEQFMRGFHSLRDPRTLVLVALQSAVLWVLVAVSNIAVAKGFGASMGFLQSMAMVTLIGIAIAIPAAPGYWGLYEAGGVFALIVLGVTTETSEAFAISLMAHLVQYVPVVIIGLFFAARAHVKPIDAARLESGDAG